MSQTKIETNTTPMPSAVHKQCIIRFVQLVEELNSCVMLPRVRQRRAESYLDHAKRRQDGRFVDPNDAACINELTETIRAFAGWLQLPPIVCLPGDDDDDVYAVDWQASIASVHALLTKALVKAAVAA